MAVSLPKGGSDVGFQQQGTIDWGQLGARTVSFSVDVLSRFTAANVDLYTFEMGRTVCSQFEISQQGHQNVEKALSALYSYKLPGTLLWFGFGARHIVRQLPTTHQGFTCVALCGALSDYYHQDIASEILFELVKLYSPSPEILTPSTIQWKSLVQACSGIFATSPFGTLVEELLQMNPYIWSVDSAQGTLNSQNVQSLSDDHWTRDGCATARSIAEVVHAIGRLSCGKLKSISVLGGNDIGWLASVSEWLFSLRIRIEDASGVGLYSNYETNSASPQVTFKYHQRNDQDPAEPPSSTQLEIASRTFILEDATSILRHRPEGASNSGRVPWDQLLFRTFGNDFQNIMEQDRQTLAAIFGSAARLLLGFATAEPGVPARVIATWDRYSSGAYGKGFIRTLTEGLPELADLRAAVENSFKGSFDEAKTAYESHISRLSLNCGCSVCGPEQEPVVLRFCRVVVIETIIRLVLDLSAMEVTDGLYPKRVGLERLYESQKTKRLRYYIQAKRPGPAQMKLVIDFIPFSFVYLDRARTGLAQEINVLESSINLFTGSSSSALEEVLFREPNISAISVDGIVIYSQILHELSDSAEIAGRVFVGAGCIEHGGRCFLRIIDALLPEPKVSEKSLDSAQEYDRSEIVITQTARGLELRVDLQASQKDALPVLSVRPCDFAGTIASMRGWVNCSRRGCRELLSTDESASGWCNILGTKVWVMRGCSLAKIAGLHMVSVLRDRFVGLLVEKSCFQCGLRQAIKEEFQREFWSDVGMRPRELVGVVVFTGDG